MQEQKDAKKNETLSVREAVSEYVHNRRWDTLVGKSYHMGSEESREEFIDFLTVHIDNIIDCRPRMKLRKRTNESAA